MTDRFKLAEELEAALNAAIIHLRATETQYRNSLNPQRIDKKVRKRLAALYADHVRQLETHLAALKAGE